MSNRRKIIILSLVLTLPMSILFIMWIYNTTVSYLAMDKFIDSNKIVKGKRLSRIGEAEFLEIVESIRTSLGMQVKTDVNMFIQTKYLNDLNNDLPKSGFEKKKAFIMIDNQLVKGKARYRGDNYYHWLLPHKSWRFETSKKNLYEKVKKYNFIIPKSGGLLGNHLSYKLARSLDLLAPDSSMKTLSVNNKYNGLKLMVEQIDESFLRNNTRMPNDIYKGDNMGSTVKIGARISTVFDVPYIWDKASINNHYPKDSRVPLEKLFLDLNNRDNKLLDNKSFVNNMVFFDLTSSFHYDAQHNWMFYYDNYYEKFYPIIWDTMGWQKAWTDKKHVNIIHTSRLFESLYNDYDFLIEKYYVLYNFFNTKEKPFLKVIDEEIQKTQSKIDLAGYHYTAGGEIQNSSTVKDKMDEFRTRIIKRFKFVESSFFGDINQSNYAYAFNKNNIRLSISGNKLVNQVYISLNNKRVIKEVFIKYLQNGNIIKVKVPYKISNGNSIVLDVNLLAQANQEIGKPFATSSYVQYDKATYDIEIEGVSKNEVKSVALSCLVNNKKLFDIKKVFAIDSIEFKGQKNIIKEQKTNKLDIWSGNKSFSGLTIIKNDIIINKGTRIILDENATVKILGKVTAIGTKEKPIIFEAKDKTKPWNALVLKDTKANGSVFKHCIFKDGSGDKGDLYEYTAMFSVHNVKNLLVEDCEFYDSQRTDDMVHVIYSDATFKNTKFIRSLSDALDVDISNLLVDNCEFINSGNDSIDLMTTNAIVINSKFTNSADKGISIGEGSNLLAINNHIKGSEIGMQSKDTSKAYIYNTSFIENKKAIDAYHKNWRYSEGGTIYLDKCIFEKNTYNATVGKKSKVVINNSLIDTANNFEAKSMKKNKIIISDLEQIKPNLSKISTYKYINLINNEPGYYGN